MKVDLLLSLTIDTDRLHPDIKERAEEDTVWAGFPVNESNTAWFVAEMLVEEAQTWPGLRAEIIP